MTELKAKSTLKLSQQVLERVRWKGSDKEGGKESLS